ncbi:MAG TPA: hypothetical protein VKB57_22570 [Acidimicrobiales bacterium]|nr:hypothetical protein [Acidimicrobiales bacterium]
MTAQRLATVVAGLIPFVVALVAGGVAGVSQWRSDGRSDEDGFPPPKHVSLCRYIDRRLPMWTSAAGGPVAVLQHPGDRGEPKASTLVYLDAATPPSSLVVDMPSGIQADLWRFTAEVVKRGDDPAAADRPPPPGALAAATRVQAYLDRCPTRARHPDAARSP